MTTVISAMSSKGLDPKNPEAPLAMKVAWGTLIGASALFIISTAGIDGIKMLAVSCGLPLLVFIIVLFGSFLSGALKETSQHRVAEDADRVSAAVDVVKRQEGLAVSVVES